MKNQKSKKEVKYKLVVSRDNYFYIMDDDGKSFKIDEYIYELLEDKGVITK